MERKPGVHRHNWKRLEKTAPAKLDSWNKQESWPGRTKIAMWCFYPFFRVWLSLQPTPFFPKPKNCDVWTWTYRLSPRNSKFNNLEAKDYSDDFNTRSTIFFSMVIFITQYMLRDFQKQKRWTACLPVLCFLLKTGHKITDIRYLVKKGNDTNLLRTNITPGPATLALRLAARKTVSERKFIISTRCQQ